MIAKYLLVNFWNFANSRLSFPVSIAVTLDLFSDVSSLSVQEAVDLLRHALSLLFTGL
jgi:hypothetical protein